LTLDLWIIRILCKNLLEYHGTYVQSFRCKAFFVEGKSNKFGNDIGISSQILQSPDYCEEKVSAKLSLRILKAAVVRLAIDEKEIGKFRRVSNK
jgi:hypothetical protein